MNRIGWWIPVTLGAKFRTSGGFRHTGYRMMNDRDTSSEGGLGYKVNKTHLLRMNKMMENKKV